MATTFAQDNDSGNEVRIDISADSDQVPFIVVNLETDDGDTDKEIIIENKQEADNFLRAVQEAHAEFIGMLGK